jgi:opacity protein-like surface antigen
MRRTLVIVGVGVLSALAAFATDEAPRFETFLGYSFVRFEPNNAGIVPSFNANGGDGQFVYNFTKSIGAAVDFGAVTKGVLGGYSVDTTVINFLAGPRFTLHNHSRFTPFVQALFGGAYGTTSTQITVPVGSAGIVPPPFLPVVTPHDPNSTVPVSARLVASETHFAMVAGGGLDIKVNKHWSFRPIGVDYYQTRFPSLLDVNRVAQHNFRYTGGINFTFGAE